MRRTPTGRVTTLTALLIALCALILSGERPTQAQEQPPETSEKPNVILILTDDMRADDVRFTPKLNRMFRENGTVFSNSFVTDSVCCPSRATFLTGLYAHNHNTRTNTLPLGTVEVFNRGGHDEHTVGRWLSAEYRTGLFGNYMKGYDGTYVPPDWDEWNAWVTPSREPRQFSRNGEVYQEPRGKHQTDIIFDNAGDFISDSMDGDEPFFAYLAPNAPHPPANPRDDYKRLYPKLKVPRDPAFNEKDIRDKPGWLRGKKLLNNRQIDRMDDLYRNRARVLRHLDDRFMELYRSIEAEGELENTIFVFTSDNGFHMGEHRQLPMKQTPYEEDIRVPLLVMGPGVQTQRNNELVLNNDFAPTVADLAGAEQTREVDGRSYAPLLRGESPQWRRVFMVEKWGKQAMKLPYRGVKTKNLTYVEYGRGQRGQVELYNIRRDPHQLDNYIDRASPAMRRTLNRHLDNLRDCEAESCVRAENAR